MTPIEQEIQAWAKSLSETWAHGGFAEDWAENATFNGNDGTPGCELSTDEQIELIDEAVAEGMDAASYDRIAAIAKKVEGLSNAISEVASLVILARAEALFQQEAQAVLRASQTLATKIGVKRIELTNGHGFGELAHTFEKDLEVEGRPCTLYTYRRVEGGDASVDLYRFKMLGSYVDVVAYV